MKAVIKINMIQVFEINYIRTRLTLHFFWQFYRW